MTLIKRIMSAVLIIIVLNTSVYAQPSAQVDTDVSTRLVNAESGILLEAYTNEVLYEYNPDERHQIASVTKVMTMLLIAEALDDGKIHLDDMVTASENAASMGGSQIFLEVGEQMSVNDMLKAIAVASGNDAAVAMAEFIGGTHEAFVEKMNKRAQELGCENTHFINCNGLDETDDHYSTARDIAIISRELLKHELIFDYTTIWMDSLRGGSFGLSNTNKLIRFYKGANGLKTGSTSKAKYCLSASAKRENMQLIAVVLCAPTTADRFGSATALLDYGFANYEVVDADTAEYELPVLCVAGGTASQLSTELENPAFIVKKGNGTKTEAEVRLDAEEIKAPVSHGQKLGEIVFKIDGTEAARKDILAASDVPRIKLPQMLLKMLKYMVST